MEKINTEIIISSLLVSGFDRVDSLLYIYTLGKILCDDINLKTFIFDDDGVSKDFEKYVNYDGEVFKIRDDFSLDTNINIAYDYELPLRKVLNTNEKLISYFNNIDFGEIVLMKVNAIGIDNLKDYANCFSEREKECLREDNKVLKR